jgi:hypothetical protein
MAGNGCAHLSSYAGKHKWEAHGPAWCSIKRYIISKITNIKRAGGVAQMVKNLLSNHKVLSSTPSPIAHTQKATCSTFLWSLPVGLLQLAYTPSLTGTSCQKVFLTFLGFFLLSFFFLYSVKCSNPRAKYIIGKCFTNELIPKPPWSLILLPH